MRRDIIRVRSGCRSFRFTHSNCDGERLNVRGGGRSRLSDRGQNNVRDVNRQPHADGHTNCRQKPTVEIALYECKPHPFDVEDSLYAAGDLYLRRRREAASRLDDQTRLRGPSGQAGSSG